MELFRWLFSKDKVYRWLKRITAHEARKLSSKGSYKQIEDDYIFTMKDIEWAAGIGRYYTNRSDLYDETIHRLREDGYKVTRESSPLFGMHNVYEISWEEQ